MPEQLLFQDAARLDIQAFVDRLVRHALLFVIRKAAPQSTYDMLERPVAAQLCRHCSAQGRMASQFTAFRAQRTDPRRLIGNGRPVSITPTVPPGLPADRRRRTAELYRDRPERTPGYQTLGYLLALGQREACEAYVLSQRHEGSMLVKHPPTLTPARLLAMVLPACWTQQKALLRI